MKKTYTMILIILMTSQLLIPQQSTAHAFQNRVYRKSLENKIVGLPQERIKNIVSTEILNDQREVVVFAPDEPSYELLLQLPYAKNYDNLLAIRISLTATEQIGISEFYEFIYPFQGYSKALIPTFNFSNSIVQLNGVEEANLLGVSKLWDLGYNGQDVVVGIIDNGVDFSHPDLSGTEFMSKNFTIPGATISYGHG
ncbi:MAG: hypothetical protein ACC656_15500, partial [Candidatus Heimdallarchaeota archaeon]